MLKPLLKSVDREEGLTSVCELRASTGGQRGSTGANEQGTSTGEQWVPTGAIVQGTSIGADKRGHPQVSRGHPWVQVRCHRLNIYKLHQAPALISFPSVVNISSSRFLIMSSLFCLVTIT